MSTLKLFLKGNQKTKGNAFFAATKSLCDENGEPLLWEIKPLSNKEHDEIREDATIEVPVNGRPGVFRNKLLLGKYIAGLICKSVVSPDLYNAELQDSYGVNKPEELIRLMIKSPGEYDRFATFIQEFNDLTGLQKKVDTAKN